MSARPFLKWAGSKQALLAHIVQFLPDEFGTYYEPFLGAGSVFLHVQPRSARLSDLSAELIGVWQAVKDAPTAIIERLKGLTPDRDEFYRIRGGRSVDPVERAAELIYLNKSCWNGLYRVNSKGEFNVPFGSTTKTVILDADNLRGCAKLLQRDEIMLTCCDFEKSTENAKEGDLVFFDPPYVTKHNFNGFRDYNEKLFSWSDQERLAREAKRLRGLGAHVIVTNAAYPEIRALYDGFGTYEFERASTLASKSEHRGRVTEVIFHG
jgi:DNA adenine methylase